MRVIDQFIGEYSFCSNFSPIPVTLNDIQYKTAEHAYQARKAYLPTDFEKICNAATPDEAKRIAKNIQYVDDWDDARVDVMRNVVEAKFKQDALAQRMLLQTNNAVLVERNDWNDTFWGVTRICGGYNILGKILMDVRDSLRQPRLDGTTEWRQSVIHSSATLASMLSDGVYEFTFVPMSARCHSNFPFDPSRFYRRMQCTRDWEIISKYVQSAKSTGTTDDANELKSKAAVVVYDVEKYAWRSVRPETLVSGPQRR